MDECMDLFFFHYVLPFIPTLDSSETKDTDLHIPILLGGEGFFKKDILSSINWIVSMGTNLKAFGLERYGVEIEYSVDTFQKYFNAVTKQNDSYPVFKGASLMQERPTISLPMT